MSNRPGTFDVDKFLEEAEDYTIVPENDDFSTRSEATDGIHELDFDIDDIPTNSPSTSDLDFDVEEDDESAGGFDVDFNEVSGDDGMSSDSEFEEDYEPEEEDFESYLNKFAIADETLEEVHLDDYNIQEDIVINEYKQKINWKMIIFSVIFAACIFLSIISVIFFNKYTLMNEHIKNCVWTNGSYSIILKDYKVNWNEIEYGQTVIFCKNPKDLIKEYGYATILDEKKKSPRQIKVFFNSSGNVGSLSIEDIYYIVVTDPNNTIVIPEEGNKTKDSNDSISEVESTEK